MVDPIWIEATRVVLPNGGPVTGSYVAFVDPQAAPTLLEMLSDLAVQRPNAIAIEDAHSTLTYSELLESALRVGSEIKSAATAPGPVALHLPVSVLYAIALFATIAAGRSCLLLDTDYPHQRNTLIMSRAGAALVLVAEGAHAAESWPIISSLAVGLVPPASSHSMLAPSEALDVDAPAFMLATSGSSGVPKLIAHSQRTILSRIRTTHDALRVTSEDRSISLASPASLTGLTGLLSILGGAPTQLLNLKNEGLGNLLGKLSEGHTTILRAVPSLLRSISTLPQAHEAFSRLRVLQTFGEKLTRADATMLFSLKPEGCLLRTSYGSTEASGFSWFVNENDNHDPVLVPAGALMPDTMAAIVDLSGGPCSLGEPGELWIRSKYNALGEWSDGQLVNGRLEPHPSGDGTRVYKTGDLARRNDDGVFVVLGRVDRMLKVNGQRVDPAEIEVVLREFSEVGEAEVVVQTTDDVSRLIAFIVPRYGNGEKLIPELRSRIRTRLPSFMMPARFVSTTMIPRLPGGKVDTMSLLEPQD